jgi:hypothetical protein
VSFEVGNPQERAGVAAAEDGRALMSRWLAGGLGVFSFTVVLAAYHIADGDLWAKLALGAEVWLRGSVPQQDRFAFTPVLPEYIDHEWGAGVIFFGLLKWFGPAALMGLKILLALGAMAAALAAGGRGRARLSERADTNIAPDGALGETRPTKLGTRNSEPRTQNPERLRRAGCGWESLLLLAIPAAACVLPGYVPVLRSHTFTYCFFAVTLLCLEEIRAGRRWAAFVQPAVMLVWANVHGGFVAGLGTVAVYTVFALVTQRQTKTMLAVALACLAVTFVNPYGLKFWTYLLPAVLAKRTRIEEWQPMPLFALDAFTGFRVLFVLVVLSFLAGWLKRSREAWPAPLANSGGPGHTNLQCGMVMLVLTAALAWRAKRHAPFFGVAALAFAGPFVESALGRLAARLPERLRLRIQPEFSLCLVYGVVALWVATSFLPRASWQVLAPVGHDPVREVDVLAHAQAEGNLATPFGWGSYAAWRLHPRVKISMDGRYEAVFPESTFELNNDFYEKRGTNWDRLIREFPVDFVLLEFFQEPLRPEDLLDRGYVLVWLTEGQSALMALEKHASKLRQAAAQLPPTTIDPLDARIPEKWWQP